MIGIVCLAALIWALGMWMKRAPPALRWSFAAFGGLSVWGLVFDGLVLGHRLDRIEWVDALLSLLAVLLVVRRPADARRALSKRAPQPAKAWVSLLWAGAALCAALLFVGTHRALPDGWLDAIGNWNERARFLLRDPSHPHLAFHPVYFHTDYPILVPGVIARAWRIWESSWIPVVLAAGWAALCAAGLGGGVQALGGTRRESRLAVALLLATPLFARTAGWLYADLVLAAGLVIAVACAGAALRGSDAGLAAAAGLVIGLCTFIKNEGLLDCACLGGAFVACVARMPGRRSLATAFGLGLLPGVASTLAYKLSSYPLPANWILMTGPQDLWTRGADPGRYVTLAKAIADCALRPTDWGVTPWVGLAGAAAVLAGRSLARQPAARLCALTLALGLTGRMVVYIFTPLPLAFHLTTSLDRVLLQLLPLGLLTLLASLSPAPETPPIAGA